MKKILAIALALVMVFALTVSVFAEEVVYKMADTDTLGQLLEDVAIGDGTPITIDHDEYGVGARIATNWVGGGATWNAILDAVKVDGAVLKLTYTGTITGIGFQTDAGGDEFTPVTDVTVVDGKNVAIIPCADIVANAPNATSGDFGGWGNFIAQFEGEIAFYGLEFVTGYEAPAAAPEADAEPEETDAEPEPEAPAAEPEAPAAEPAPAPAPATGIALAVVPAVMALAAVAVSKKH